MFFESLQIYHSLVLHPPFFLIYSTEICTFMTMMDCCPTSGSCHFHWATTWIHQCIAHSTEPLSLFSYPLFSERQNLANYLVAVQSLFILETLAKIKVCSFIYAHECVPSLSPRVTSVIWDLAPWDRISCDDKNLTPQRRPKLHVIVWSWTYLVRTSVSPCPELLQHLVHCTLSVTQEIKSAAILNHYVSSAFRG